MIKSQTIKERIVERYSGICGNPNKFSRIIEEKLKQSFRINTIKGDKEEVLDQMKNYDPSIQIHLKSIPITEAKRFQAFVFFTQLCV